MSKPLNTGIPNSHYSDMTQTGMYFPGPQGTRRRYLPARPGDRVSIDCTPMVCDELLQQKMEERVKTPI